MCILTGRSANGGHRIVQVDLLEWKIVMCMPVWCTTLLACRLTVHTCLLAADTGVARAGQWAFVLNVLSFAFVIISFFSRVFDDLQTLGFFFYNFFFWILVITESILFPQRKAAYRKHFPPKHLVSSLTLLLFQQWFLPRTVKPPGTAEGI